MKIGTNTLNEFNNYILELNNFINLLFREIINRQIEVHFINPASQQLLKRLTNEIIPNFIQGEYKYICKKSDNHIESGQINLPLIYEKIPHFKILEMKTFPKIGQTKYA